MNTVHTFSLIAALLAVAAICFMIRRWSQDQRAQEEGLSQARTGWDWKEYMSLLDRGHCFCTLFNESDIELCAKELGIAYLTRLERVRIIAQIKIDFDPELGINYTTIKAGILKWQQIWYPRPLILEDEGQTA